MVVNFLRKIILINIIVIANSKELDIIHTFIHSKYLHDDIYLYINHVFILIIYITLVLHITSICHWLYDDICITFNLF